MPTWKQVAMLLGARVESYAFCNDHRRLTKGCPYCEDIRAYRIFVKKRDQEKR